MLIDESKMAVDSSFSFLNLRKQHTNLKLKLLFKIETRTTLTEQIGPLKLLTTDKFRLEKYLTATDQIEVATTHNHDQPGSGRYYTQSQSTRFRSPTIRLLKPITDTQTRQNCLRN